MDHLSDPTRDKRAQIEPEKPSKRSSNSVQNLYSWIRTAVLNGKFPAGSPINQAQLAVQFGVSRTPLREALRMLQAEGLLVGEINQRMRVATIAPSDVDSVYATRILLECIGLAATVPRLTEAERQIIGDALTHMNAHAWIGDRPTWEVQHTRFHSLLVQHAGALAGPILNELIANFQLRCERYRRLYVSRDPTNTARAIEDHTRIAQAVIAGSVHEAVIRLSEHYSHTALAVLKDIAPNAEAIAIQNCLSICRTIDTDGLSANLLTTIMAMPSAMDLQADKAPAV